MRPKYALELKRRLEPLVPGANLNWSALRSERLLSVATGSHQMYIQSQCKVPIIQGITSRYPAPIIIMCTMIYTEWPKKMYTLFTHQYLWN